MHFVITNKSYIIIKNNASSNYFEHIFCMGEKSSSVNVSAQISTWQWCTFKFTLFLKVVVFNYLYKDI